MKYKNIILILCVFLSSNAVYAIKDPTKPPDKVLEKIRMKSCDNKFYDLNAIIISKSRKIAVINGKTLSIGESIDGSQVIEIEKSSVYLKKGSSVTVLSMIPK